MPQPVLFIDDGGVMNDNTLRAPQWQRLLGEFFAPILGGTSESWAEANRIVAARLWEHYRRTMGGRVDADYAAWNRTYQLAWLGGMCEAVGVPTPPEEETLYLARRAGDFVTRRVQASFPGAIEAIREMHARGFPLHTASGESSIDLGGYLEGMGVQDCFGRLYGPDLVNTLKEGPEFYERVFDDAQVSAADAVVVDDSPVAIHWASQAGARTVLIADAPDDGGRADLVIPRLAELPRHLEGLG